MGRIRTPLSNQDLFEQLEERVVEGDGDSWRVDVYSIVNGDTHRWIQLGLEGRETRTVLLKLAHFADDRDALAALEEWLHDPASRCGSVVTVAAAD